MVLGPLLLLTGVLLRVEFHFFFPQQLIAYERRPMLMTAAYACFAAGNVAMWPAVAALARRIGASHPAWAVWGGTLVVLGLFTRTFHAGTDHIILQLVDFQSTEAATRVVGDYYAAWGAMVWHPFRMLAGAILTGWAVLAIGAYRSGALGLGRAIALGLMSVLALGTVKGTQVPQSVIATAGLCIAFVPMGVGMLLSGPRPSNRALCRLAVIVVCLVLGPLYAPRG